MHVLSYVIGAMFFVVAVALCIAGTIAGAYAKPVESEPEIVDAIPVYDSFMDRDHFHNMTGESDPELIRWTHCLSITHCPSICDCYLDEKPCTAELLPEPLDYIGKHRAYNPHKVYRGEMNSYVGKHSIGKYGEGAGPWL